jgi:hypothetical protein
MDNGNSQARGGFVDMGALVNGSPWNLAAQVQFRRLHDVEMNLPFFFFFFSPLAACLRVRVIESMSLPCCAELNTSGEVQVAIPSEFLLQNTVHVQKCAQREYDSDCRTTKAAVPLFFLGVSQQQLRLSQGSNVLLL